ncbi:MAG: dihydrofolate reductase family protein [Peptococcaceae bacterium]|nr:dihydrofolate reductase family protein [Peptococcaceae bacterium]
MRKIILCIAISLDGYIADKDGKVDFVFESRADEPDTAYQEFYSSIDRILYGSATYRQMKYDMGFEKWPYPDKLNVVFSGRLDLHEDHFVSTALTPREYVDAERQYEGGDIWLFGGQKLIRSFMADDLVDRYFIYICPTVLGAGIPLFDGGYQKTDLRLVSIDKTGDRAKFVYDRAGMR